MPETRLKCPNCEAVLKTTATLPAGKSVKCPKCQGMIRVPGGQPASAPTGPPAARPKPAPPPKADPDEDEDRDEAAEQEEEETPRAKAKTIPAKSPPRNADPDEDEEHDDNDEEEEEETPRARPKAAATKSRRADPDDDEDQEREDIDDEADEEEPEDRPRKKKKNKDKSKKTSGLIKMWLWLAIGGAAAAAVVAIIIATTGKKDDTDRPGRKDEARTGNGGGTEAAAHTVERTIETQISLINSARTREIASMAVSHNGIMVALAIRDSTRKYVVDAKTGTTISEWDAEKQGIIHSPPVFSPDDKWVVFEGNGQELELREIKTGRLERKLEREFCRGFRYAAFSPQGDNVFVLANPPLGGHGILGWSVASGQPTCLIKLSDEGKIFTNFVVSPDGKTLVIGQYSKPNNIEVWDIGSQSLVKTITTPYKRILHIAVSADGKQVCVQAEPEENSCTLDVWNLEAGSKACTVNAKKDRTFLDNYSRFAPNGDLLDLSAKHIATHDAKSGARKAYWEHAGRVGNNTIACLWGCDNGEVALFLIGLKATIQFVRLKE